MPSRPRPKPAPWGGRLRCASPEHTLPLLTGKKACAFQYAGLAHPAGLLVVRRDPGVPIRARHRCDPAMPPRRRLRVGLSSAWPPLTFRIGRLRVDGRCELMRSRLTPSPSRRGSPNPGRACPAGRQFARSGRDGSSTGSSPRDRGHGVCTTHAARRPATGPARIIGRMLPPLKGASSKKHDAPPIAAVLRRAGRFVAGTDPVDSVVGAQHEPHCPTVTAPAGAADRGPGNASVDPA